MFRTQQATPPHSPHTLSIALGQANSASTQFESPLSPSLGGSQDDLSARCRALARSVGSVAKEELWHPEHAQAQLSPRLATGVLSPLSPSAAFASPLSPRSMGPPTPDGSCFSLEEIEEEREDDTAEPESDAAEGSAGSGAGKAPASALTDDEGSDAESIRRGRRRDSGHGSLQLSGMKCERALPHSRLRLSATASADPAFFIRCRRNSSSPSGAQSGCHELDR